MNLTLLFFIFCSLKTSTVEERKEALVCLEKIDSVLECIRDTAETFYENDGIELVLEGFALGTWRRIRGEELGDNDSVEWMSEMNSCKVKIDQNGEFLAIAAPLRLLAYVPIGLSSTLEKSRSDMFLSKTELMGLDWLLKQAKKESWFHEFLEFSNLLNSTMMAPLYQFILKHGIREFKAFKQEELRPIATNIFKSLGDMIIFTSDAFAEQCCVYEEENPLISSV